MESTNALLAMDSKGRVRVSLERREMLLREFDGGGLSAAAFARHVGVRYQIPQLRGAWVEASVNSPRPSGGEALRVELPGGAHAMMASQRQAQVAAELLRALVVGAQTSC